MATVDPLVLREGHTPPQADGEATVGLCDSHREDEAPSSDALDGGLFYVHVPPRIFASKSLSVEHFSFTSVIILGNPPPLMCCHRT